MAIKVVVADDAELVRKAIRSVLQEEPDIQLVGEVGSFSDTLQVVRELKPHVTVLDVYMPDLQKLAPQIVKSEFCACGTQVVAISLAADRDTCELASSLGAVTVLDKINLANELIPTIKRYAPLSARAMGLSGSVGR